MAPTCIPMRMNIRLFKMNSRTSKTLCPVMRVSAATASDDHRRRRTPATTTASTPDAPIRSAGRKAANGVRSQMTLSTIGSFEIVRRRDTTRYTARPTTAPPRPTRRNSGTARTSENLPVTTAWTAWPYTTNAVVSFSSPSPSTRLTRVRWTLSARDGDDGVGRGKHGPEHERGRPRDAWDGVARNGGDDDRRREDEADREQRDGPQVISDLANRRRRRGAEEQGWNEHRKRHVRLDRQLPDDRRERSRDAAQDHDDGHRQPHLPRQRRQERRREEQPEEGLEPLHGITLSERQNERASRMQGPPGPWFSLGCTGSRGDASRLQRDGRGADGCSDSHRVVDVVFGEATLDDGVLVASNARLASVDRADGEAHQLEVRLAGLGLADAIHAQACRLGAVALFSDHVAEAVVHVVHRHEGGGGVRVVQHRLPDLRRRVQPDGLTKRRMAGGHGARHGHPPALFVVEGTALQDGRQVELDVPRG